MFANLTPQHLQRHPRIIVSFHSSSDSLKVPANTLTIYRVSADFLKSTAALKASLQASNVRQENRGRGGRGVLPWLIRNENLTTVAACFCGSHFIIPGLICPSLPS